ncbi:MAG: hypothetical protein COS84_11995 [Armatimonadetes bacterium CG07_land_8_20_14_0_80_40_9]|nr:MAG: hypothetical protein COS84_11995 [Armatimonadetes bacterium CG07_land_8_20_14_0_80_40_9]
MGRKYKNPPVKEKALDYKRDMPNKLTTEQKINFKEVIKVKDVEKIETISQIYSFKDSEMGEEVIGFLNKYDFLLPIVNEAPTHIFKIFGDNVKLYLELHTDPEEGWDELFIVIKSSLSPDDALKCLDNLDDVWFLDLPYQVREALNITEEPI